MIKQSISQFNGGMGLDPREQNFAYAQYIKGFDIWENPRQLVPTRRGILANGNITSSKVQAFIGSGTKVWGLGITAGNKPAIFFYADITTSSNWSTPANNTGTNYNLLTKNCFVEYKTTAGLSYFYGWNSLGVWRYGDTLGSPTFNETFHSLTASDAVQGVVHNQDDTLYLPYADANGQWYISKYNNTTFTDIAITMRADEKIVRIAEYGTYLAILVKSKVNLNGSRLYLWDRDTGQTIFSENLFLGNVRAITMGVVDGNLIIVSILDNSYGNQKLLIQQYLGGHIGIIKQIELNRTAALVTTVNAGGQVIGGKFYFSLNDTASDQRFCGLWCVGRKDESSPFSVAIPINPNTSLVNVSTIDGFFIYGDVVVIAHSDNSSVTITNFGGTDYAVALYESQMIIGTEIRKKKQLAGISVSVSAQPSAGSFALKYKKDEETSFTQIFTDSTANTLSHSSVNIESTGDVFPDFNEKTLQVQSNAGTKITQINFNYEEISKDAYD